MHSLLFVRKCLMMQVVGLEYTSLQQHVHLDFHVFVQKENCSVNYCTNENTLRLCFFQLSTFFELRLTLKSIGFLEMWSHSSIHSQ
ncbi:unnamed protein product [Schistosoma curassoni]|uniref:Secreted protein n=1 Tax=Schistosoma curassoni TaxID=6186 RepID=A0A183K4A5_9TREM|nr:unnamed protein product [Schistosoma curassoni]